jgi:hypothetical protein
MGPAGFNQRIEATMNATANNGSDGSQNGRGPGGRFGPNNTFSKGNVNAKRMLVLRRTFLEAVKESDVRAAAEKLASMATSGEDLQATKLYLEYAIGKPVQPFDASGLEGVPYGPQSGPGLPLDILTAAETRAYRKGVEAARNGDDLSDPEAVAFARAHARLIGARHRLKLESNGAAGQ